jgi:hypothetical protein
MSYEPVIIGAPAVHISHNPADVLELPSTARHKKLFEERLGGEERKTHASCPGPCRRASINWPKISIQQKIQHSLSSLSTVNRQAQDAIRGKAWR